MSTLTWGMLVAGIATLIAGLILVRPRFAAASGPARLLVLGPVFEASALAIFAAEHFFAARALATVVPPKLPFPLFWAYFVGACLLAAAISFIANRHVALAASLLAVLLLIIVATIDLPNLGQSLHNRLFWILTVRETCFAAGALVLAGSAIHSRPRASATLITTGRTIVAVTFVFYAVQHFLHPLNVPGVPLEKLIPAWFPAPALLSCIVGATLLATGIGLLLPRTHQLAAAIAGALLVLLTALFYVPIFLTELHSPLAIEGLNYIGDTLLFAATALLAGFSANEPGVA